MPRKLDPFARDYSDAETIRLLKTYPHLLGMASKLHKTLRQAGQAAAFKHTGDQTAIKADVGAVVVGIEAEARTKQEADRGA